MKNFTEEKKELEEILTILNDKDYLITSSHLISIQLSMYGMILTNQTLLKKIIKELKIELKDDDDNVIPIDEYCEYYNKFKSIGIISQICNNLK